MKTRFLLVIIVMLSSCARYKTASSIATIPCEYFKKKSFARSFVDKINLDTELNLKEKIATKIVLTKKLQSCR